MIPVVGSGIVRVGAGGGVKLVLKKGKQSSVTTSVRTIRTSKLSVIDDAAIDTAKRRNQQTQMLSLLSDNRDSSPPFMTIRRLAFHTSAASMQQDKPNDSKKAAAANDETTESLQDTIERLKATTKDADETKNSSADADTKGDAMRKAASIWDTFRSEVSDTWNDLLESEQSQSINKKIHPTESADGDAPYTGPVDIMVIDEAEQLTAWERMQKRLTDAPIIQDMLTRSEHIYETSGAKKATEKLSHIKEDATEAWETSQNPWVYRVSSVYDTVTAESMESIAVKDLRILDPSFTLEGWRSDVVSHTLPNIMDWFLSGRINQLKPWLGDGVFTRMAAEMKAREKEGTQIDTNVLGIMNSEILAIEVRSS